MTECCSAAQSVALLMPVLNCFLLCFATYRWDNWIKNIPTVLSSGSPESPFPGVQRSLAAQQVTSHLPYCHLPLITEHMKSPSLALFVCTGAGRLGSWASCCKRRASLSSHSAPTWRAMKGIFNSLATALHK